MLPSFVNIRKWSKTDLILVTIIIISAGFSIAWVSNTLSDKHWEKLHPLIWDDFRGIPDLRAMGYGAVIKADLKHQTLYEWKITQGSCHYWFTKVEGIAYMSKMESWVRPDQRNNLWGLIHEQIHFDIVQIHAKKFNERVENELLNRVFLCPGGSDSWSESKIKIAASAKVTAMLNQVRNEIPLMQKAYDEQTIHGMNYEEQKRWEYMVKDMLDN